MRLPISRPLVRSLIGLFATFGWLLAAGPLGAYIVYLKDGSELNTKDKPRIEGDKAILTMLNGSETFLDASEIDFAKTEEVNKTEYGAARLIEGRGVTQLEVRQELDEEETFTEFLSRSNRSLSLPESSRRDEASAAGEEPGDGLPLTRAGFLDLKAFRKTPYPNEELRQEILRFFFTEGFERIEAYEGTKRGRVLLEVGCNSEALVFKALYDSARLLGQLEGKVSELELLMLTSRQQRGGQFLMNAERAELLTSGRLAPSSFFLRFVEF